ncbi:MAG TPA: tetratricopeptide repeat-containing glycosyltransferase family protein [Stellaceae bacterium]
MSPEQEPPTPVDRESLRVTFQQGLAFHQQGRLAEAERCYDEVLRGQPNSSSALYMLGLLAFQSRQPQRGVELTARAIALNPNVAEAHNNLGNGLIELKRPAEALASFDRAVALKPDFAEAHNNRGAALNALGRFEEALQSCERAIALRADYAEAHYNRGLTLKGLRRAPEALASYDKAIALRPDYADAHNNRAILLNDLGRHDEALESCDRALALRPDHAEAHNNRAATLADLARDEEALASYDQAMALMPEDAGTHFNRGVLLLRMARFAEGWREFEWRKRLPEAPGARSFPRPLWLGDRESAGKTVLVHAEQGYGDSIHFARYARLLAAHGARVVFSVPPSLCKLFVSLGPGVRVVADGELPPEFDCHCPLLSLPAAFGTTLETIPAEPRYLAADTTLKSEWDALLPPKTKPRIGIVWSGNPDQGNDRYRSMPLEALLPLISPPADWVALQNDVRDRDTAALRAHDEIIFFGDAIGDFSDTAALIELMDLVIAVDTSVAHLAGALGKPVWIMLADNADWRWLRERADCPWYPSARLFRQERLGDWTRVIAAVGKELRAAIGAR